MTRQQQLKLINKFEESCEKPLSAPRPNETPSQERYRLLCDVLKRTEAYIDAGLCGTGEERGAWIRFYWEIEGEVYAAQREMQDRCIEEGRQ